MTAAEKPLVAVVGPTASGKSELALMLAERFGGEIISCDSVQVYRGFDIGTAKLQPSERRGIPHYLIDVAEANQVFTAGDFLVAATKILGEVSATGHLPIVAGGTGFYLRALLEGITEAPSRDDKLRRRLAAAEGRSAGRLHRYLTRIDPMRAAGIHPNDVNKTMRAIEIYCLSRRPASALVSTKRPLKGHRLLKIGLSPERELLNQIIEARSRRMFAAGLVDEVRRLLAGGVAMTAKPFESLGYKQSLMVLEGQLSLDSAIEQTALETRQYVKRQLTWFRRDSGIHWMNGFGNDPGVQATCGAIVAAFLQDSH